MKKLFIPLIAMGLLTACGGNTETTEENSEVESMVNDHDHEKSGPEMPAIPSGAKVYFANLADGSDVSSPLYLEFAADGIEVEPAGEVKKGFGHHHILINEEFTPMGEAVPADDTHIHYGGGQKDATIELDPGTYLLTLQFADGLHRSYGKGLSETVKIKVVEEK